jgi:hypothetical protein
MATIEIIIRDETGKIIAGDHQQGYELDLGQDRFEEIERAVEQFKQVVLPDIEVALLNQAQQAFIKKRPESERNEAGDGQESTWPV